MSYRQPLSRRMDCNETSPITNDCMRAIVINNILKIPWAKLLSTLQEPW